MGVRSPGTRSRGSEWRRWDLQVHTAYSDDSGHSFRRKRPPETERSDAGGSGLMIVAVLVTSKGGIGGSPPWVRRVAIVAPTVFVFV